MIYCEKCREERDWPKSNIERLKVDCQVCGKRYVDCYDLADCRLPSTDVRMINLKNNKPVEVFASFRHVFESLKALGRPIKCQRTKKTGGGDLTILATEKDGRDAISFKSQTNKSKPKHIYEEDWGNTFNHCGTQINVITDTLSKMYPERMISIRLDIAVQHDWDPQDIQDIVFYVLDDKMGKDKLKGMHLFDADLL